MWIRSQDKKGLYKVKRFEIFSKDSKWRIVSWTSSGEYEDFDILGEYDTETRCIKILNDIQEKMFDCSKNYVYELPNE